MKVSLLNHRPLELPFKGDIPPKAGNDNSFGSILKEKLDEVNQLQQEADAITEKFLVGQVQDLHQVTIAAEKANLALQLTVQIRNKIVEAYQEISRMQI